MVSLLRQKLNTKKIGHSGTLDPFAEGVLVMGIGNGTRILEYLKDEKKVYTMTFRLGLLTDTYDIQGEIISDENVEVREESVREVVKSMVGPQKQVPPIYSAKKYKGKKLYEYAREGKIIKMPPRDIVIYSLNILRINGRDITVKAVVSPGTYMRSLAYDIGLNLSTNASALALVRNVNGKFSSSDCVGRENLESLDKQVLNSYLITIKDALSCFPLVKINSLFVEKVMNGNPIQLEWIDDYEVFKKDDLVRIVNDTDQLIAVGCSERNASFIQTLKGQKRNEILIRSKKVFFKEGE